jgi:hypothetical protein
MDLNSMALEELSRAYRNLRLAEAVHERRLKEASAERMVNARSGEKAAKSLGAEGLRRLLLGMRSRRSVLTRLSAAGLAALVMSLGADESFASGLSDLAAERKKRRKKRCPKRRRCGKKRCCKRGQVCSGGACKTEDPGQGTCPAGANSCLGGIPIPCNGGNCLCVSSTEGDTRCAQAGIPSTCGACTSNADCTALGPGAFCFVATGCGCAEGEGQCTLPCAA